MELVPFSECQLTVSAKRDPVLRCVFWGVYTEDQLTTLPPRVGRTLRKAFIVNADPKGEPEHTTGYVRSTSCLGMDLTLFPHH